MKVLFPVDKKAAFLAGFDSWGERIVVIKPGDLTPEERQMLVEFSQYSSSADFSLCTSYLAVKPNYAEANLENLKDYLHKLQVAKEKHEKKERQERQEFLKKWQEMPLEDCLKKDNFPRQWYYPVLALKENAELKEKLEAAKELAARKNEELREEEERTKKRREEEEERAKAERERKTDCLRQWAINHGSELLKKRIQYGYEWVKLARKEFAQREWSKCFDENKKVTFSGYECDGEDERTTPTLEEIKVLEDVQKKLNGEVELVWCKYVPTDDCNYYEEVEPFSQTELKITIKTPDGGEVIEYFHV